MHGKGIPARLIGLVLALALVLAGCGRPAGAGRQVPAVPPAPTATFTPVPTFTPTATATPSPTPTPLPTFTPLPAATPTPTATPTPAPTPTRAPQPLQGSVILYAQGGSLQSLPPRTALGHPEVQAIYRAHGEGDQEIGAPLVEDVPAPSPGGHWLVVSSSSLVPAGQGKSWLLDLVSGDLVELAGTPVQPSWSPDGRQLAYVRGQTLYTLDVAGEREPVAILEREGLIDRSARWSPAGEWIAVASAAHPGQAGPAPQWTYWLVSPDGQAVRELGTLDVAGGEGVADALCWSPDGTRLAAPGEVILALDGRSIPFADAIDDSASWMPPELAMRRVARDAGAVQVGALAHNGQQLAYGVIDAGTGSSDIYVFERILEWSTLVGTVPGAVLEIRWSPGDDVLLVGTRNQDGRPQGASQGAIYALQPRPAGVPQLLIEGQDVRLVDVIPDALSALAAAGQPVSPVPEEDPRAGRALVIDQALQVMYVYEKGILVRTLPVSTGMPTSYTFTRAWVGEVGRYLGRGWVDGELYVDDAWFLFKDLYGNILIHSVPYTPTGTAKVYDQPDAVGVRPSSHGCVRISPADAQWLKAWDPVGVPIEIGPPAW